MAASEAAVTTVMEVLVLHQSDGYISSRDQWVGCTCGERLPCRIEDGYADEDDEHRARAAHIAVAAADAAVDADRASIQAEALREAAHDLSEATEGPDRRGTAGWAEPHRDVYSLAIEECRDALRARADRIEAQP